MAWSPYPFPSPVPEHAKTLNIHCTLLAYHQNRVGDFLLVLYDFQLPVEFNHVFIPILTAVETRRQQSQLTQTQLCLKIRHLEIMERGQIHPTFFFDKYFSSFCARPYSVPHAYGELVDRKMASDLPLNISFQSIYVHDIYALNGGDRNCSNLDIHGTGECVPISEVS